MDWERGFYKYLMALAALALILRAWGIWSHPPNADEVMSAFTAANYMERGELGPTMPNHPVLRNIILWVSTGLFGAGLIGLRGVSLVLGTLGIVLLGLLTRRITGSSLAGLMAAGLMAMDTVHIIFSRQSIQEVWTVFFFLLGVWLLAEAHGHDLKLTRHGIWLMPLAGVALGLGLACKSHGLFPLAMGAGFALYAAYQERDMARSVYIAACLMVLPLTVYFITWLPWFQRGYDLGEWAFMQRALMHMTVYHEGNPHDSMIDTEAWQWFLRPFMGYADFAESGGQHFVSISIGNPIVWMAVLPALAYLLYRRTKAGLMLAALFLACYLPLALAPRPIWVLSSLAVTPFAYGMVALVAEDMGRRHGMRLVAGYMACVVFVFAIIYPLSIGYGSRFRYLAPIVHRFDPHSQDILRDKDFR